MKIAGAYVRKSKEDERGGGGDSALQTQRDAIARIAEAAPAPMSHLVRSSGFEVTTSAVFRFRGVTLQPADLDLSRR